MDMVNCWLRVKPAIMSLILECGRVKTQFDSCISDIAEGNIELRAEIEQKWYGYDLHLPAAERPVYGYLCCNPDGLASDGHNMILLEYGKVAIRLKDEVKGRTTFVHGDSLYGSVKPSPYSEGELPQNIDELLPYVEAAYHGGICLSDIEEVVFLVFADEFNSKNKRMYFDSIMLEINKLGIRARYTIIEMTQRGN